MSSYPMCEKMGLKVCAADIYVDGAKTSGVFSVIKASEVESLLASGVEASGDVLPFNSKAPCDIEVGHNSKKTHSGLLIGYKPIEKPKPISITKEDLAKAWRAAINTKYVDAREDVALEKLTSELFKESK